MNDKPIETAIDQDLRLSHQAMRRAAQKAREIAAQTGTAIVTSEQGIIHVIHPQTELVMPSVQESKAPYGDKP